MELVKAKEFPNFKWLNTKEPLSLSKLKGHIVVLDFWTYCCINCMHMIAELTRLEHKYKDKPVVFIGVHSAKFYNEQDAKNIEQAIMRYEIEHPVIVDEDMSIWRAYNVNAWPTIVIIDPNGNIVYKRAGEGQYELIDDVINILLTRYSDRIVKEPIRIVREDYKFKSNDKLSFPGKISFDPDYNYIAISDSNNNRILVVKASDGRVVYKVGSSSKGLYDGSFDEARFFRPQGIVWSNDASKIYVADTENHALRVIDLDKRYVKTIVGNGMQGYYSEGGYALTTSLNSPWDLAIKDNKILFIAMAGLHQIWAYYIDESVVRPFAGSGYEGLFDSSLNTAEFAQPSGLSIDGSRLYVADSESSSIRVIDIDKRYVKTIVGKDLFVFGHRDGRIDDALLQHPLGVDAHGDIVYVADTYNHAIRVIDLAKGEVSTLIGRSNAAGCRLDDSCTLMLYEPSDVKLLAKNNMLYIADTNNHLIRIFNLESKVLHTLNISF